MATQTFAVGVLKHLESIFFAPLEKENSKLSELRKVLESLLQFFSDPNLGYRRLLCLDVLANFPRDETGNQWQHIIEQVLFVLTKEVEQLGKKKARVHLPSFNIFHKILHLCEERNPGHFLERIAKKLFDHVYFALSRCLCTESKYVEIVTVYERILTLLMKSPLYCKAFKWDLLKKFTLFCFDDDYGRVDQMTTDLLRIVVTSFTYDYEAKNMFHGTEEYDGDFNSIFYQISFAFKSIILPGRASGESADTIADVAKNLLCVLNVLMEKCGLNVVSALYRWGHTSFQYALASMTDSLPLLRDESLRYLQNHMRLLRDNTKWYGLTKMKKYSIAENISNMYEVLVETNILTKFLSQAGSPSVKDGSGKIEFDRATTSSMPLERHARLAADILFYIDLTSMEVPGGTADKDDWVKRYCRVGGGSPLESKGTADSSGSSDFLSPNLRRKRGASSPSLWSSIKRRKTDTLLDAMTTRRHVLESMNDLISDTSRKHYSIFFVMVRVFEFYPDWVLCRRVQDRAKGKSHHSLAWLLAFTKKGFELMHALQSDHPSFILLLSCLHRSLFILKHAENTTSFRELPKQRRDVHEIRSVWRSSLDLFVGKLHRITAVGHASSAGRNLLCLTVAHGLRTGYIEQKNHDVVWQLPFEKGIFHNVHALALVFASLSCPNFSASVDHTVRVKLLKYVLSCAEILFLGENCDGTHERAEIVPENVQYTYFVAAVMCSLFSSDCSVVNLATISDREEGEINIDKDKIVNGAVHNVHIETKISVDKIMFDVTQSWWTMTGGQSAAYSSAESSIKMQQEMHRIIFSWLTAHVSEDALASHEHSKLIKCICASYFGAAWLQTAFSIPACAHLITTEYVDVVANLLNVVIRAINSGCLSVDVFVHHRANILHKVAANVIEALCVRLDRLGNSCATARCFQDIKQALLIALSHDVKRTALRFRDFQTSVKTYFAFCSDRSSTSSVNPLRHDDDDFHVESANRSVHDSRSSFVTVSKRIDDDNRILVVGSAHLSSVYENWPMVDGPKYFGTDDYLYFHERAIQWFLHRYSIIVLHYLKTAQKNCGSQVETLVDETIQAVVHEPNWKRGSHFFFLSAKYLDFLYQRRKGGPNREEMYQTILNDMAEVFILGRRKSLVYINDNSSRVFFWTVLEIFRCLNITMHEARCNVLFRSLVDIISTMNTVHRSQDEHYPQLLPRNVRLTSQYFCAQLLELHADSNEDLFEAIMAQVEDWMQDEDYYVRCASGETYSLLLNGRSIDDKIVIYEDYERKFRPSSGSPKLEFQTYVLGSLSIGMKCNELIPRVLSSLVDFCADNEWGKHLGIYCLTVLARSCLKEEIEFRAPYALLTEHMHFVLSAWVRADFQRPVSELGRFPFSVFYPSHVFNSIESFFRRFMHVVVAEIVVQGSAAQADTCEGTHSSLEELSSKRSMLLSSLEKFVEPTNWKGTSGLLCQYFGSIYAFSRSFTYLPDPSIEDDGDCIKRMKPSDIANHVDEFLLGAIEKKRYYTYTFMNRCEIVPWLLLLDPSVVSSPVNIDDYREENPPKLIRDAKQYIFDKIKSNPEGGGPVLLKIVSSIDVLSFLYTFATCSHDLRTFSLVAKALRVYVNCSPPQVSDDVFITLILSLSWFLCDKSASCWFDCCCIVSQYIEKHLVSRASEGKTFLEKKMNLFMRIMLLPFVCPREVILKEIDLREYTQVKTMASKGMNSLFATRRRGSLRDAIRRIPDLPKIEELQALVSRKSQERSTLANTIRYFMTSVNNIFFNNGLGVHYSHYVLSNISDFAGTSLPTLSAEAVNTSSYFFEDDIVAARADMDTNILTPYSGREKQVGNTDSGLVSRFAEAIIEICNCPSVSPSIQKIASTCLGVLEQGGGSWYASRGLGEDTLLSSDLANTAVARSNILAKCLVDRLKQCSCRGSAFAACFSGKRDLEITKQTSRGKLSITLREIVRDDFQEAKRSFELGEHLWQCGDTPFPVYVTRLAYMCATQYILEDSFQNCAAACLLDPCFAEAIFPLIILTSLRNSRAAPFVASNLHSMVMQERYNKKKAVLVIRTLDYLRKQGLQEHQHKVTSSIFATKQVDYSPSIELSEATVISFLDVAKLAHEHNMNSLALLYTELFDKNIKTGRGRSHVVTIDSLHKLAEHESLLLSIYKRLNSADSLSGSSHKSLSSLLNFDEKDFSKPNEANVAREQMEWQPIFDTLRRGDLGLCKTLIDNERDRILYAMKHASIFEMKNRRRHMQALCVLDQVACVPFGGDSDQKRVDVVLEQWGARIFRSIHETEGGFNAIEPLLKQREKILRALKKDDMYFSHVLRTAIVARQSKQLDAAEATIVQLKCVNDMQFSSLEKQIRVAIEESLLMAAKGQLSDGILFAGKIKDILQNVKPSDKTLLLSYKSNLLRTLGKWTAVMRSESSDEILDKYFLGAVKFAGRKNEEDQLAANFAAGKYMNTLYLALLDRLKSPEWEELNRDREQTRKEWHQLKKVKPSDSESRSDSKKRRNHLRYLKHILDQDDHEVEKLKHNMTEYLFGAAKRYIFCLSNVNVEGIAKNQMSMVVRLLDILFKNPGNVDLQKIMQDNIDRMNMNAFLPFVQQITSRITDDVNSGPLIRTLEALLVQMLVKAPDHCLPPLLLLRGSSDPSDLPCDRARSKFSRCVLKQYRTLRPDDGQARVDSYINIIEAFSKLALWVPEGGWDIFNERKEKVGTKKGKKIECSIVPGWDEGIRRADLERGFVPIWTDGANGNYTFRMRGLDQYFKASSSGLSVPKIIKCLDNCGASYKQYLKGGDDLRQDEVMEQVFRLVNTLLHQDQKCRQRQLQIRTYKVVPFSNSVGLIEHVQNSTSLKEYLTAAHKKWHPSERTPHDVFQVLADAYHKKLKEKERVKIFQRECRHFNPAMYEEMVSRISDTDNWYKQRLAYTRSVAVNSVIGYIIGLGDRHVSNVMIDETTHELVHIDFGVAFEQGKCLPCPEKVPFRLSRDLVHGMGVSGYEGVFQRCSEETLRVLKSHQDALLFVFDAFLHNPLCDWKVSGVDWMKKNGVLIDEEDENVVLEKDGNGVSSVIDLCDESATEHVNSVNKLAEKNRRAERAIGRIRQKLNGYHDGNLMGVEGHIKSLINEATDFRNLGTIFPGWNPHL